MTRNTAVTVRLPGASSAPTTNTWTCSQTRLENTGANFTISRVRATGTVSMPHLFWHKSEGQLTNLSLCFQSPLQMDKVEISGRHFRDYHLLLDEHADQIFAMTDAMA